ncbi:MAG: ACT domain-containing protein [Salinisphaera sp.]|jgi:hypothetical protein|nr:ACT domain-containing protein [Salinisphaera sp.]
MAGDHHLARLLVHMAPKRQPGIYRFATLPYGTPFDPGKCVCVMREPEGVSIVAETACLPVDANVLDYYAVWIVLSVHSALEAVGLTAAVSGALAGIGISCNVIAGARHDHLFVSETEAERAMECLQRLQCAAITANVSSTEGPTSS